MDLYRNPTDAEMEEYAEFSDAWLPFIATTDANKKLVVQIMLKLFDYEYQKNALPFIKRQHFLLNEKRIENGQPPIPWDDDDGGQDIFELAIQCSFSGAMYLMANVICNAHDRDLANTDAESIQRSDGQSEQMQLSDDELEANLAAARTAIPKIQAMLAARGKH